MFMDTKPSVGYRSDTRQERVPETCTRVTHSQESCRSFWYQKLALNRAALYMLPTLTQLKFIETL